MKRLAALLAAVSIVAGFAPAHAMTDTITVLKQRDHLAIQRRLGALLGLTTRVKGAARLSSSDRSALLGQFTETESGLKALDQEIQSDSTVAAVREDQSKIVTDYRVYVLVVPKTYIVIAADRLTYVSGQVSKLATKLEALINAAKTKGRNTSAAESALADMKTKAEAAANLTKAIPETVLPLEPSGYPGNRSVLLDARGKLVTARDALRAARADAAAIIAALK